MADASLSVTLATAVGAALVGGIIARLLRQSVLIGYIAAGMVISPFTPGPSSSVETIERLADIGVVLLMFGVGIHFSLRDLLSARAPVIGAAVQIPAAVAVGFVAARVVGWTWQEGLFFGAAASISSTIVLTKLLAERGQEDTTFGRIAMIWALAQDIATVALVVLLAAVTERSGALAPTLGVALLKAALFLGGMVVIGTRVFPWALVRVARFGSRDLFILAVGALSLGTAVLSERLGLSLALGAFIAGVVVSESDLSHHVLGEILPVRDIFAALFFVSVGMLVDPMLVLRHPFLFMFLVAVVLSKGVIVTVLGATALRLPLDTAVLAGAGLAQSAEFSFILERQGVSAGAVSAQVFGMILSATAATIVLAPLLFRAAPAAESVIGLLPRPGPRPLPAPAPPAGGWRNHVVIAGAGRVGTLISRILRRRGQGYVFIEMDRRRAEALRAEDEPVIFGDAAGMPVLEQACLERARTLVVAVPDPVGALRIVDEAHRRYPRLDIIARAASPEQVERLRALGAAEAVIAERELGLEMTRHTLHRIGVPTLETQAIIHRLRFEPDQP